METQKQWLLSYSDLGNIRRALLGEASRLEDPAKAHLDSHKRQINELVEKVSNIMAATGRIYDENDKDDEGTINERLLVSLIPANVNERWEEPYTVIPVGAKWAVVSKETVERPVGEKLYTQATHAYRACRRLNAAYWENETSHAQPIEKSTLIKDTTIPNSFKPGDELYLIDSHSGGLGTCTFVNYGKTEDGEQVTVIVKYSNLDTPTSYAEEDIADIGYAKDYPSL